MTTTSENVGEPQAGLPHDTETQWKIGRGLAEIIAGLAFSVVAGFFLIAARDLPASSYNPADPGTAAFPDTMGGALLACSLALVVIGIFRMRTGAGDAPIGIIQPLNVIATVVATVLYALVMPYVTYYAATVVWVPLVLLLSGTRSWKWIVSLTVLTLLVAHFIFEVVLSVNLP